MTGSGNELGPSNTWRQGAALTGAKPTPSSSGPRISSLDADAAEVNAAGRSPAALQHSWTPARIRAHSLLTIHRISSFIRYSLFIWP